MNSMIRTGQQIDSPRAWRMAGVAFAVGFIVFGVLYSFGVFLEPLMTDFGASRSATSALYAISSTAFYFLGPVTGWIGDRWGPRLVSAVGAVAMTASLGATALVDSVWTAYLTYGLGVGLGQLAPISPRSPFWAVGSIVGAFGRSASPLLGQGAECLFSRLSRRSSLSAWVGGVRS